MNQFTDEINSESGRNLQNCKFRDIAKFIERFKATSSAFFHLNISV